MYYYHEQNRTVGKQDDSSHTVTIIFCFRDFSQIDEKSAACADPQIVNVQKFCCVR